MRVVFKRMADAGRYLMPRYLWLTADVVDCNCTADGNGYCRLRCILSVFVEFFVNLL